MNYSKPISSRNEVSKHTCQNSTKIILSMTRPLPSREPHNSQAETGISHYKMPLSQPSQTNQPQCLSQRRPPPLFQVCSTPNTTMMQRHREDILRRLPIPSGVHRASMETTTTAWPREKPLITPTTTRRPPRVLGHWPSSSRMMNQTVTSWMRRRRRRT